MGRELLLNFKKFKNLASYVKIRKRLSGYKARLYRKINQLKVSRQSNAAKIELIENQKQSIAELTQKLTSLERKFNKLKAVNHNQYAKITRLENASDKLQVLVREQSTQTLDELFFGVKK